MKEYTADQAAQELVERINHPYMDFHNARGMVECLLDMEYDYEVDTLVEQDIQYLVDEAHDKGF